MQPQAGVGDLAGILTSGQRRQGIAARRSTVVQNLRSARPWTLATLPAKITDMPTFSVPPDDIEPPEPIELADPPVALEEAKFAARRAKSSESYPITVHLNRRLSETEVQKVVEVVRERYPAAQVSQSPTNHVEMSGTKLIGSHTGIVFNGTNTQRFQTEIAPTLRAVIGELSESIGIEFELAARARDAAQTADDAKAQAAEDSVTNIQFD